MLKSLEISGFKSFANQHKLEFDAPISAIVGPNGSGKSNAAEAFRFVLGEQSLKALRVNNTDELLFNGGQSGRRKNRAHVKARLDNTDNTLDIDYDEVQLQRVIERGDASTYRLNGSRVRLKDVTDLLSDANIGTSRHHIISQGESDRILNINNRERKSVVEDALGLRRFYRRRREAERKLEKTEDNLVDIQTRLEDIKPEFQYLKRQKTRIEKTKKLRDKLTEKYRQFFRRQELLIDKRENQLTEKRKELEAEKQRRENKINQLQEKLDNLDTPKDEDNASETEQQTKGEIEKIKAELEDVGRRLNDISQKHGRIEGKLEAARDQQEAVQASATITVSADTVQKYTETIEDVIEKGDSADDLTQMWNRLVAEVKEFLDALSPKSSEDQTAEIENRIENLQKRQEEIANKQDTLQDKKADLQQKLQSKQAKLEEATQKHAKNEKHKWEKELLKFKTKQETTETKLNNLEDKEEQLQHRKNELEDEKSEAKVLCGEDVLAYDDIALKDADGEIMKPEEFTDRDGDDRDFKRELERLKIKLEDTRVSDPQEVKAEYDRVKERTEFFQAEIEDLKETQTQLQELIDDINKTVESRFSEGLVDINEVFSDFFQTMFGGGSAQLFVTKHPEGRNITIDDIDHDPEVVEKGVGIQVQLPNKKIRGLEVLSGGERALASIALLFSLSQINPPPFIVLDEADAALDEANSRRFGNIIEKLAEDSQLIIITHNRETMRRADLLYGVTMDNAGGSRLLSLDFSEAVEAVES